MTRKWIIRAIAVLMALIMALSVLYVVVGSFTAKAATTQSQIDNLKKQQKEIEKKKQELQAKINSLQYEQSTALAKKEVLDDKIDLTQQDIANTNEQIEEYAQLIEAKKLEVIEAQKNEDDQLALFKARLRTMEENGTISYISVIFNAYSFTDLLARIDVVGEIMTYDEQVYEQLKSAKQATKDAQASLEQAKEDQEAEKAKLVAKEADLQAQMDAAEELVKQIQADINQAKAAYQAELDAGKKIQNDINKKLQELKKQQQQVVGTGKYKWPTPSCYIVTSPYGKRYHPIFHEYRTHAGVDIGAKSGADIIASDSGVVIISAYSSSYGNYVVISHGNGITTLYAHMSKRLVKEGAKVTQGQVIGKVGSTGNSTGPHLHFEISINGVTTNPLKYFSGYSIQG